MLKDPEAVGFHEKHFFVVKSPHIVGKVEDRLWRL